MIWNTPIEVNLITASDSLLCAVWSELAHRDQGSKMNHSLFVFWLRSTKMSLTSTSDIYAKHLAGKQTSPFQFFVMFIMSAPEALFNLPVIVSFIQTTRITILHPESLAWPLTTRSPLSRHNILLVTYSPKTLNCQVFWGLWLPGYQLSHIYSDFPSWWGEPSLCSGASKKTRHASSASLVASANRV